jgi:uncharacterized lipoprotein YddW (UPF0748 family)
MRIAGGLIALLLGLATAGPGALPARAATAVDGPPRRALWIETSANLRALSSRDGIRALVARARRAGFDTLVPEAKNAWGFVIYESTVAPHIRTSPVARHGYPPPARWYPGDFDALGALIEEAHAAGLRVHAAVNAFGEGVRLSSSHPLIGLLERRPEWESVHLRAGPDGRPRFIRSSDAAMIAFVNPSNPAAQLYELATLWEVVSRYDLDGVILDRARYAGVDADFSEASRAEFEARLGRPMADWPQDVLQTATGALRPGPLFGEWVAWRASVIQDYVRAAVRLVRRLRPRLAVGMYVGAWYPTMFEVGQNWARPEAPRLFRGWSQGWAEASLLPDLDYLMIGLYYRRIAPWESGGRAAAWHSVAGGAALARQVTGGFPLIGSVWLRLYEDDRPRGRRALAAASRLTDGLMVFDLSDLDEGWWETLTPPAAPAGVVPTPAASARSQ